MIAELITIAELIGEHTWRDIARDIILIASVCAAVYYLGGKWLWRYLTKWVVKNHELRKTVESIPRLFEIHDDMDKTLAFIVSELKPNSGTSMKDAINRIEVKMDMNEALMKGWWSQDTKPMYITDEIGNMVWCNKSYLDLVNKDTSEVYDRGYWSTVDPAQIEELKLETTAAAIDKRDMLLYYNLLTGDPDYPLVPCETSAIPILDKDKKLKGYVGSIKRLDGHGSLIEDTLYRVEKRVEKNEAMIRGWWAQEDRPMYMNDILGNCVWVNAAMVEFCGRDSLGMLGKGWITLVHPNDRERLDREIQVAASEKREVVSFYTFISGHEDVKSFKVKAVSTPLFDKDENVIGYIGTLKAIDTNRRKED